MSPPHDFASDNHAGVHPAVLDAVAAANAGHVASYGADEWTARAADLFRRHFGEDARAYLVFNGSGANVACIDAVLRPHEAVICAETAHMNVDECGAPERIAGAKLLLVPTADGKLTPDDLGRWDSRRGDEHSAQARLVSITQSTELGTLYTAEEIAAIAERAHSMDMLLHVDGARLANAAASLDLPFADFTTDAGVDLLSFGGTKNGLMFGEAMVVLRPELAPHAQFVRKQLLQLNSKMRFCAAQFEALLEGDLWLENARNANAMASRLEEGALECGVEIAYPVEANGVFAKLEPDAIERLTAASEAEHPFYVWDDAEGIVRWMCAWDTTPTDVDQFCALIASSVSSR
ncbi:MAG TPA: low specificity L-threonine aldolase [Solirubrobacterales bacterium]|nr:low specificity L-threonine aldolase [Solirubrobacterales bacterium]